MSGCFDAQARGLGKKGTWPLMNLKFLSQCPFFCNGPAVVTTMAGETKKMDIPPLNRDSWSHKSVKVKSFAVDRRGKQFIFTVVPADAATRGYHGMEVIGKSGEGFTFSLAFTPAGKTWPAGSAYRFLATLQVKSLGR